MSTMCGDWRLRLTNGLVALAVALLLTACATEDMQRTDAKQHGAEPDLTDAHLDKRKFLLGVSMLGKSVEQDLEILRKITGHTFEPKEDGLMLADGSTQFRDVTRLSNSNPMLIGGGYIYNITPVGFIRMSTDFVFNTTNACISVEDLEFVLGKPTKITYVGGLRKGTGPSNIWNVTYHHPSGGRSVFFYGSGLCSNDMVQSATHKQGR